MNKLPIFVLQLIQNYGNTRDQISLQSIKKGTKKLGITIIHGYYPTLNDSILLKYAGSLKYLSVGDNSNITNASVKELKLLHTLNANCNPKITDISIKEL